MKRISYAVLVGCVVISSATNCREWETTAWFKRADSTDKRETYKNEVARPVIEAEINALKKEKEWSTKQADNWISSYYEKRGKNQSTDYEGKMINFYRGRETQIQKDILTLQNNGVDIVLGYSMKNAEESGLSGSTIMDLRSKFLEFEENFNKEYSLTPEEAKKFQIPERQPSGAFFSPLEE